MGFLFVDYKGQPKFRHSYSAGVEFDANPLKFYLRRIVGWGEKDTKAALLFGRALESAIQFFHENNGEGAAEEFARLWIVHKDKDELVYTKRERNWESLNRAGREMMQLYKIRQPGLPMPMSTRFQREFTREVFPGDPKFGGIEFYGKLDAMPSVDPYHPLLTKIEWQDKYGLVRPVIIDIKTSGQDFSDSPGICAHDIQLRSYSWLTGKRDVGFLWFKKNLHEIEKGTSVTVLQDRGPFKAGEEAVVAHSNETDGTFIVHDDFVMDEMKKFVGDKPTTKESKVRKMEFLENAATKVSPADLTRQRLQFNSGIVSIESAEDVGRHIGNQIARIVAAWDSKTWPNTFGVRFPHDDCQDPFFRAFIQNDTMFRDSFFEKKGEEPMDDFGEAAE